MGWSTCIQIAKSLFGKFILLLYWWYWKLDKLSPHTNCWFKCVVVGIVWTETLDITQGDGMPWYKKLIYRRIYIRVSFSLVNRCRSYRYFESYNFTRYICNIIPWAPEIDLVLLENTRCTGFVTDGPNNANCRAISIDFISKCQTVRFTPLRWRHNESDGISNRHPHDCSLKR